MSQTIPNLPSVTSLSGAAQLWAVQNGTDVRVTAAQIAGLYALNSQSPPVTIGGATYTVGDSDFSLVANFAGSITLTLPAAGSYPGRILWVKTVTNNTVASAASNVVPLASTAAGTAILSNTAGKYAVLQSDGSSWLVMQAN